MAEPITVLLVDEDRDIVEITETFLEREADLLEVESAMAPDIALQRIENEPETVDCVVSDYTMPEMTGVEFLESVRERDPDLPFFFFTGRDRSEIEAELDVESIDGYVQKGTGTDRYAKLAEEIVETVES